MRGRIPASPGTGVPEQSRAVGQRGAWAGTPTSTLLVCKVGLLQLLRWGRSNGSFFLFATCSASWH